MIKSNPNNTQVSDITERDDVPRVDCSLKDGTASSSNAAQACHNTASSETVRLAIDSNQHCAEDSSHYQAKDQSPSTKTSDSHSCGCGGDHKHDHECNCGGEHKHAHECGCGGHHDDEHQCKCGSEHKHAHECGCGGKHEHSHKCGCQGHDEAEQDEGYSLARAAAAAALNAGSKANEHKESSEDVQLSFPYDLAHGSVHGTHKPLTSLLDSANGSISGNGTEPLTEPFTDQLVDTCPLSADDYTANSRAPAVMQSDIDCLSDLINGLGDNAGITASIGIANENLESNSVYHTVQTALSARENENGSLSEKRLRALEKAKSFSKTNQERTSRKALESIDKKSAKVIEEMSESPENTDSSRLEGGMKAQYSFDRNITFPGFGIYDVKKRGIFLDKHAVAILDLDQSFISTWVSPLKLFRIVGREVTHKIFAYTRTLQDTDKDFVNPCLAHGNNVCPYTEDNPEYSTSGGTDDITVEDLSQGRAAKPIIDDPNELLRAIGCPLHEIRQIKEQSTSIANSLVEALDATEPLDDGHSQSQNASSGGCGGCSSTAGTAAASSNIFDTLFSSGPYADMPSIEHKSADSNTVYGTSFVTGQHSKRNYTSNDALPVNFDSVASNMQYSAFAASQYRRNEQSSKKPKSNLGFRFGLFGVTPRPSKAHDPHAIMPETKCTEVAKSHLELTHSNGNLYRRYEAVYLPGEHSRDRASFAIFLRHGKDAGSKIYLKLNAFYENECLSHISVTFTRVASYLFAMLPHVAAESASYDWLTSTGECVFGSNYYSMLGYRPDDPRAKAIRYNWHRKVVHPDDKPILKQQSRIVLSQEHGDNFEFLYRSRCRNGSYIWTKSIGTVVARNEKQLATRILGINIDINRVIEGYENLQSKVFTDILTGLKNRTYLTTHLPEIIGNTRGKLSVIFTDVTALKAYNDYLGHTVGDRLLCSASILISSVIDMENELIRISGDEIVCLIPDCNEEQAATLVKKLNAAVKEYNVNAPVRMPVFFSCGAQTIDLSEFTNKKLSKSDLTAAMEKIHLAIQEADKIMQVNKRAAHEEHYSLVKEYIEQSLKQKVEFNDKRLFA